MSDRKNGINPINIIKLSKQLIAETTNSKNGKTNLMQYNFKNPVKYKRSKHFVDIYKTKQKFDLIYADPPWRYVECFSKKRKASIKGYDTMSINDICDLPIKKICSENSILLLWTTAYHFEQSFKVINSWGFDYITIWLNWNKEYTNKPGPFLGMGTYNRQGVEHILIGTRKSTERVEKGFEKSCFFPCGFHLVKDIDGKGTRRVFLDETEYLLLGKKGSILPFRIEDQGKVFSNIFEFPVDRTKHSKKPIQIAEKMIPKVFPHVKNPIELFARNKTKWNNSGKFWNVWGNECMGGI